MATEKMGAYKKKGAAESKELSEKGPVDGRDETMNKEGSDTMGPGRGSKKGDQSATKLDYEGPGRSSGYTQNFGPARVSGYTKGAAKVNSIMGKGPAEGFFDTIKKVARTGTRALGDIGIQAIDFIKADQGSHSSSRRSPGATTYSDKYYQKQNEKAHYQKSRDLTASGKTYFNLSNVFDDDGEGNVPPQTITKKKGGISG